MNNDSTRASARPRITPPGRRTLASIAVGCILMAGPAAAAEQDRREHDAHEHGHGTLGVVLDGEELLVELRMPAFNVVGFEHEPSTDAQRRAIDGALEAFGDGAAMFVPSAAARCELEASEVDIGGIVHEDHDDEGHDDEHGEKHAAKDHGDEHHAGHDEAGHDGDDEDDGEEHRELHAEYRFHCDRPEQLEQLEVRAFDALRDVEEIEVQIVTPTRQAALELEPDEPVIELGR